jgi:hypothetical protein
LGVALTRPFCDTAACNTTPNINTTTNTQWQLCLATAQKTQPNLIIQASC